jgi:monooxygenase
METATGVIVIGAGMTGIAAGYYLREQGIPYIILEAKDEVGGVWHAHRWHGVRCDSDFIKYSFSFRPFLSRECLQSGATIQRYLREVAEEFSIREHIRFGARVEGAEFRTRTQRWTVQTAKGEFQAPFLINGNGYFADEPHIPAFKGVERFKGEVIHTSHLDGSRTFPGKRVVLVGSGATAVCCAPALAAVSKSLVMLQRSPTYIYETDNQAGAMIRLCQALYRLGVRWPVRWLRAYLQARDDLVFVGFRRFPRLARWFFHNHWRKAVGEEALREHFNPRYDPWDQRIAVAIGLKDKLRTGAITMKTGAIERFTESSIVLESGDVMPCDVCVLATGLNLRFFSFDIHVDGARIAPEGINLYKGIMAGGIPNYFHPLGSWHSAWTQRMEPLMGLALRIMAHMRRHGYGVVSVPRREHDLLPGITPNYVLRSLALIPRLEGTTDLPSLDNLLASRVDAAGLRFA